MVQFVPTVALLSPAGTTTAPVGGVDGPVNCDAFPHTVTGGDEGAPVDGGGGGGSTVVVVVVDEAVVDVVDDVVVELVVVVTAS
jgi:hypothetical protein